ncbi:MAG: hypothetical protein ABSF60_02200 [Verrucomicrobiota bacterium]|jgi:hypothetical protein
MPQYGESNTGTPGVIKINYPKKGQIGYLVKAQRRENKIHEIFYVRHYGGDWKKCYAAAKAKAKEFFLENPRYSRKEVAKILTRRNKSGIRGVRIRQKKYRWKSDPDRTTIFLDAEASWSPRKDQVKKRTFSLEKYGEREAWRLARKARKKGLQQMEEG